MLRALSLTQRLTVFFTVLAAVIVLGLGLVFIQATERHFVDLDRGALQDKKYLIKDIVLTANSAEDTKWRLNEALGHHDGLFVMVKDSQGNSLYRSQGFDPLAAAQAPTTLSANGTPVQLQHWHMEEREFRSMTFRVKPAYDKSITFEVLAAIDTGHHDHFLVELRSTLIWYALIAVASSGVLGWLAAHQGLAPLRAMKAKAAAVSGHQFSERMPVQAVPVEMADLASELNGMLDRLQDDYRRLSEFSSDLAHELRTPISNLLTQTQVALSAKRDAPTYRNILASNAEELERMARMVSDMLFLAKAERGMALPGRERFAVAPEIRTLLEFYDAMAEEKGVRLSLAGDGEIDGDRLMFRRALGNLLSNAVRHGDAGSQVAVAVERDGSSLLVSVENAADDIPPAALPRLFDRFFRVDPSRRHPAAEGAGLGLSITRAIVQAHGGDIQAESHSRCVRFVMRFPALSLQA
ncbi:heavy metal sensor kinase [Burkholderiales bacterium JOSHI_001]|nr:heavy metal sensor kinase [Burkholderiales bacterium JOSHI_001]